MLLFDPPALHRLRCRPVEEDDLDALTNLLSRGFPRHRRQYWTRGFERWRHLPAVDGLPRYGHVLEGEFGLVGALLLISSEREGQVFSHLSNWYVEPAWRAHSPLLVSLATRHRHVTYLSASPPPAVWRVLQAQGFRPYNFGRSAVFAMPGKGAVSTAIDDDLPEARLLRDHRELGLVCVTVTKDGRRSPFVFKPRRLDAPPVKMLELIHCRGTAEFRRCAPALARHFLRFGVMGFLVDGKVEGIPARWLEGREPRYYKGPQPPALNDLAYSEKTVFG